MPFAPYIYEQTETDLINQLESVVDANGVVLPMPENVSDFKNPQDTPIIYVGYRESYFTQTKTSEAIMQSGVIMNEEICFDIIVRSRKVRGQLGFYTTLALVRLALLGFQPSLTDAIFFKNALFVNRDEKSNVYDYTIDCRMVTLAVSESYPDEPVLADQLKKITILDPISGDGEINDNTLPPQIDNGTNFG